MIGFPLFLLYSFLTDWGASASPFTFIITINDNCKLIGYLESLGSLEELGELVLSHIHLPSIHELQDGCEVREGHVLQDDDGMLGGILLQKVFEVWRACTEDHLVCLSVLALVKHEQL